MFTYTITLCHCLDETPPVTPVKRPYVATADIDLPQPADTRPKAANIPDVAASHVPSHIEPHSDVTTADSHDLFPQCPDIVTDVGHSVDRTERSMTDKPDTISDVANSVDTVEQRPCATDARDECHGKPTGCVDDPDMATDAPQPLEAEHTHSAYFNYDPTAGIDCDGDYNESSLVFEPISYAAGPECIAKIEDDFDYEMELQHTQNQMLDSLDFDRLDMQSIVVDGASVFGVTENDDSLNNSEEDNSSEKSGNLADEMFTSPTLWNDDGQKQALAAEPLDFDADFSQFASFDVASDTRPTVPADDLFSGDNVKSNIEMNGDDRLYTEYNDDGGGDDADNLHCSTNVEVNDSSSSSTNSDKSAKRLDAPTDNAADDDEFDEDDEFGDFSDFQQTTIAATNTEASPPKPRDSVMYIVDAQHEFNSILASMFPSADASGAAISAEHRGERADSFSNEITKQLRIVDETRTSITNNNWKKSVSKSFLVKALGIDQRNIVSSRFSFGSIPVGNHSHFEIKFVIYFGSAVVRRQMDHVDYEVRGQLGIKSTGADENSAAYYGQRQCRNNGNGQSNRTKKCRVIDRCARCPV